MLRAWSLPSQRSQLLWNATWHFELVSRQTCPEMERSLSSHLPPFARLITVDDQDTFSGCPLDSLSYLSDVPLIIECLNDVIHVRMLSTPLIKLFVLSQQFSSNSQRCVLLVTTLLLEMKNKLRLSSMPVVFQGEKSFNDPRLSLQNSLRWAISNIIACCLNKFTMRWCWYIPQNY